MLDYSRFDSLSFDCYGTLIDWETGMLAVMRPVARRGNATAGDEALLVAYGEAETAVEAEHPAWVYPDVLAEAFRRAGAALDFEMTAEDARRLGTSVGDWPAFPDSAEALQRLKQRFRLIILSNVHREGFAGSNKRLGVEFDALLLAQDIGSYKPSPHNFDALLTKVAEMGIPRGRLLHVAQSLFHDHVPARRAGLPSVWINRRHGRPGWGATPDPGLAFAADAEYASMAAFADAVDEAFRTQ
jgi:2-haloalkanoic acid dehalogenase type II